MTREEDLRSLEFGRVLSAISALARSEAARTLVRGIRPFASITEIDERFGLVSECLRLRSEGGSLGIRKFEDARPLLDKIRPVDSALEPLEILSFLPVFENSASIILSLRDRQDLPLLRAMAASLTGFPELSARIGRSIGSEGEILDSASGALYNLRADIKKLESKIRRKLEDITSDEHTAPFLQDTFITRRSGRWVIPVRMDSKGRISGVVHDVSRSGDTAFMEPLSITGLSNELENLYADARAEEIRILRFICAEIRAESEAIASQTETVIAFDLIESIAMFAESLGLKIPEINSEMRLRVSEGRHPLLLMSRKKSGVVPLELRLDRSMGVTVITGPNAGGKTVAIKTAGLLTMMALSGIPVPASESSTFPLVESVLADIGDEQSVEANLSTFSAHIGNISGIVRASVGASLVLIDELGTGTDPVEGAAIGAAVLKALRAKGALVLATTHLSDIVAFVHRTEGMENASMDYDRRTLSPLYRLVPGEPGQSHALDIAARYGLPPDIIEDARKMAGTMNLEFGELLSELRRKRKEHEDAVERAEALEKSLRQKDEELRRKLDLISREREEAMRKAYAEAKEIIYEARREVRVILEEAKKEKKKESIKKLDRHSERIQRKIEELKPLKKIGIDEIEIGDTVLIGSLGTRAEVTGIDSKSGRLRVLSGSVETDIGISEITGVKKERRLPKGVSFTPAESGDRNAEPEINLLGLRADEAIRRIEPFLNNASLAGLGTCRIIHGLGTGALKKAVKEHLTGHPLVKSFSAGLPEEGGDGVTVVELL